MCNCEISAVESRVKNLEDDTKQLADVILGTPKTELEGGGRNKDGIKHEVLHLKVGQRELKEDLADIKDRMANGGIKLKVPKWVWGALAAIIGAGEAIDRIIH